MKFDAGVLGRFGCWSVNDCTGRCTMQEDENGDHVGNPECPLTGHSIDVTRVETERVLWQIFTLAGHAGIVIAVSFSPDGNHIATGLGDDLVKIWDTQTGAEVSSFVECGEVMGVFAGVALCRFCLESSEIMVNGWQVHTLTGHSSYVMSVDFSPDGNRVASGSEDNLVKIWDIHTGAEVSSFLGLR